MDRAASERPSFRVLLRRYRLAAGLTHEALAERAALSPRTISDLERGVSRAPRSKSLRLLADAMDLLPECRSELELAARDGIARGAPAATPRVLPSPLSTFVGRERDIQIVETLLSRDDVRLVTLTGPGGTGKTRLAIRVAEECGATFADGTFFVSLAPIEDADDIPAEIARAVGIEPSDGCAAEALVCEFLRSHVALLVLDNCEHLLSGAPQVAELLAKCPGMKILATSRCPLQVGGEHEFPVAPLDVPDLRRLPSTDVVAQYDAVALFAERARQGQPRFEITDANAADVVAVCARVDGLPLAIELAAARVKLLTPRALLVALESPGGSLHLLTGGKSDAPGRQRTLRATITWSYELLTQDEQRLLRQLAVFVGGCTVTTACAIASRPDASPSTTWVLDGLGSLLDKSLLRREDGPDEEPRFGMLKVVQEFAAEQLEARGEAAGARERHARHFLAMVESTGPVLLPSVEIGAAESRAPAADSGRRHLKVAAEQDNLRAALRWLVECG